MFAMLNKDYEYLKSVARRKAAEFKSGKLTANYIDFGILGGNPKTGCMFDYHSSKLNEIINFDIYDNRYYIVVEFAIKKQTGVFKFKK